MPPGAVHADALSREVTQLVGQNKLDLYKLHKFEYAGPRKPALIDTKPGRYFTIDGRGKPGGPVFNARLGALYNAAFTVKMAKKASGKDYAVCKLEGLWWLDSPESDFSNQPDETWNWKLMIRIPDFIEDNDLREAIRKLKDRGKSAEVAEVRLENLDEGRVVQMLHVGPYDDEARSIAQMKQFVEQQGLAIRGLHHEIYLSDPRRVPAARLRTILRYPVG
jgi:hypothetical protein